MAVWCLSAVLMGVAVAAPAASRPLPSFQTTNTAEGVRALRRLASGDWQLDLAVTPGKLYVLESTTNQIHWRTVLKFASPSPQMQWTDPAPDEGPASFYRVVPRGFHSIRRGPEGVMDLLLGVQPGPEHVLETSTNLSDWTPWTRFISRGPVLRFQHAPPPGTDRLFFRARPTEGHRLELQADGAYLLLPTQTWGTAYRVETSTNLHDWSLYHHFIGTNSVWRLAGPSAPAQLAYRVRAAAVNEVYDAFIILGQSNAVGVGELADREPSDPSVWMFGNDYQFKMAYEPVDDATGQVDAVSRDPLIVSNQVWGHSWSLRAAKGITAARGNQIVLIPCAKGSTSIDHWFPQADRFDRATLFGSANYRRSIAAAGGLKGIWYYGHESSSEPPRGATYIEDWSRLIREWRRDCGPVPVIYAQLAGTTDPGYIGSLHAAAEKQRRMETGFGDTNALPAHHMVVAFDLPLLDPIHLNRVAVNTLADRLALATRQHIYGEPINGTGPRLVSLRHPQGDKSRIEVRFNRPINRAFNNYDHQFRVFSGGGELILRRVERAPDESVVWLTLATPASNPVTVSYGQTVRAAPGIGLANVVKDADGLPAPRFGPLPVE
jgi:hypothetical protein